MRSSVVQTRICGSLVLILSILAIPCFAGPCETIGSCYIAPAGAGAKIGVDWNNAYADLPANPTCHVTYFVAGGTYNEPNNSRKVWYSNCTVSTQILVYKAVDCAVAKAPYCGTINPASIAGWQASYGTLAATFVQPLGPDLESNATAHSFLTICGCYYTIDGVTPTSGTPTNSGFGFVWRNPNPLGGMIGISSAPGSCITKQSTPLTNITIRHSEFDGVDAQYGIPVTAYSRFGNVVTLTLQSAPGGANPWVVGDYIDLQGTGANRPTLLGINGTQFNTGNSGNGVQITGPGSPGTPITGFIIIFSQIGNTDSGMAPAYADLNYSPAPAMSANFVSQTYDSLTVSDNYIHDVGGGTGPFDNVTNMVFQRNYVARDRSTYPQHENAFDFEAGGSFSGTMGPVTVSNNIFEDIGGTEVAGTVADGGMTNNFMFYNNLVYCTDIAGLVNTAADPQCGVSRAVGDNGTTSPGPCIKNATVIGNTFYGGSIVQNAFSIEFTKSTCSTSTVQNNLWYTNSMVDFNYGLSHTENHNTVLSSAGASTGKLADPTDSVQTAGFVNPFAASVSNNFAISSDTADPHLNDGISLSPPYDLDFVGRGRKIGGWTRGAHQWAPLPPPITIKEVN